MKVIMVNYYFFSSPEPKAQGELFWSAFVRRPSVVCHLSSVVRRLSVVCQHLPCEHDTGHIMHPIIMKFCQNVCLDEIWVK